jgi:hypothetical protein
MHDVRQPTRARRESRNSECANPFHRPSPRGLSSSALVHINVPYLYVQGDSSVVVRERFRTKKHSYICLFFWTFRRHDGLQRHYLFEWYLTQNFFRFLIKPRNIETLMRRSTLAVHILMSGSNLSHSETNHFSDNVSSAAHKNRCVVYY